MDSLILPCVLFQVVSPKQWTAWVYPFVIFWVASSNKRTTWTLSKCHP